MSVLITNRKSHTGFRLVPTSVTLNNLERRNSPALILCYFASIALQADYFTVVEDRIIISAKYRLLVIFVKANHTSVARSFCDS